KTQLQAKLTHRVQFGHARAVWRRGPQAIAPQLHARRAAAGAAQRMRAHGGLQAIAPANAEPARCLVVDDVHRVHALFAHAMDPPTPCGPISTLRPARPPSMRSPPMAARLSSRM